jgi:predicted TIM-barrel fold metal-dependent hydrolase
MTQLIDCDTHLFEPADMWSAYVDPDDRDVALRMERDELGYTWLMFGDRRLSLAEPHRPGEVDRVGSYRQRWLKGLPADFDYEQFAAPYSDPAARLRHLDDVGFDAAILFPNYGIGWERPLQNDRRAALANMAAWNRWIVDVAGAGRGRLHPVAHLSLTDIAWLERQLDALAAGGIRLGLIPPALVGGKPMSHPELDRAWAGFVDHGITPVFHVANQPRPFDEAWYGPDVAAGINPLTAIFLSTGVALAVTDLILNGTLERFPDLRLGIMELSAIWVPLHLQMMDGGLRFVSTFNGEGPPLSMTPSEYFTRQVRVGAFAYEQPEHLARRSGDIFMACSDWPHTEGTATPLEDYRKVGSVPEDRSAFFGDNAAFLLRQNTA